MGAIKTEKLAQPREAELEDWTERAIDYGGKAAHCIISMPIGWTQIESLCLLRRFTERDESG